MSKEQLYHYNDTIDQLQQENKQLKKEIAEYKEVLETYKKKPVNIYQVEIRNLQVDKAELKLELEEKDKKIAELEEKLIDTTDFKDSYYHDLEELKKENQLLRKTLNNLKGDKASDTLVNAVNAVYEPLLKDKFDDIERLKKELAEKDEEIKELKNTRNRLANTLDRLIFSSNAEDYKQELHHEICEKIRKIFDTDINYTFDIETLYDVLDEIEQGDE